MVKKGEVAPDFTLVGAEDGSVRTFSLGEQVADGAAILSVYVFDFSLVCTSQMCDLEDMEWLQMEDDISVLGLCPDSPYSHAAFAEEHGITYPLLSDFDKDVCDELDILQDEQDGVRRVPRRSLFLIDSDRRVQYRWVADDNWNEWDEIAEKPTMEVLDQARTLT